LQEICRGSKKIYSAAAAISFEIDCYYDLNSSPYIELRAAGIFYPLSEQGGYFLLSLLSAQPELLDRVLSFGYDAKHHHPSP